jgi:beta-galactosidase
MARKPSVHLTRRAIQLDGKDVLFYSGEFVPERTPPERWRESLTQMKAAGCTAVTFVVPWNWHEVSPGDFDFTGRTHPQRNLLGFLEAIEKAGLLAVPRPGPFITFEWRNGGIPDWFFAAHPEAQALTAAGVPLAPRPAYPPISYLHPAYVDACRHWFDAVLPILAERQYTVGGPIIEVYLDDEPSYFQLLKGDPTILDYNPVVVGDGVEPGYYQRWLERRFNGDLRELNDVYRTQADRFATVDPPRTQLRAADELPRYLDWYDCKLDMIIEHVASAYGWARELGIDVPLAVLFPFLAQYYQSDRLPREFRRRGLEVHIAGECYPSSGAHGVDDLTEDAIGHIVGNTEAYRSWWKEGAGPPISIEAQASQSAHLEWHGMELYYTLLLGHGLNGMNMFMMVGGETPRGFEAEVGGSYDLSTPISASGELRPHYWLIRRLGEWLTTHSAALASTEPQSSICYAYYPPYEPAGYGIDTLAAGLRDDYRDALVGYFGVEGAAAGSLATLMPLSGADFAMVNLEHASLAELSQYHQLWTVGLDFMSEVVQQRLVDYVRGGGHLVLLPRVPDRDARLRPFEGPLAELFPARPLDPRAGTRRSRLTPVHAVDVPAAGVDRALVFDYLDTFELPPGAEPFALDAASGRPCAYTVRDGRGRATLLGFKLRYQWDPRGELKRLVNAVLDLGDVVRPAWVEGWELTASLRRGEGATFVFVTNPSDVPQTGRIHWTDPERGEQTFPQQIDGLSFPRRGGLCLSVEASIPKTPAFVAYATSQIQTWRSTPTGFALKLYAHPGVLGEVAFRLPGKPALVSVDGGPPVGSQWDDAAGVLTVVYRHDRELLDLELALA